MNTNEYRRNWYQKNLISERTRLRASNKKRQAELFIWLTEYKANQSCKCGEKDPACLDFHHRNPDDKKFDISSAVKRGCSKGRILEEIAKCDVLCSNCHRKLHYKLRRPCSSMD